MTETEEILERVRDRVKNLTRPLTSREAYERLVKAFGEAATWARDPMGIESEAISVAAFAVLLASVAKKEQPSPEDRARSLHGKLDRILKRLEPVEVRHEFRDAADPPEVPDADNEGPCPSCGAELGRDHRPGCRLPGVWSDLTHCQRVVQERRQRCIVLWNALRYLNTIIDGAGVGDVSERTVRAVRIARVALEGGPLGHQGEIVDGVDRLRLDDLERVSGAKGRPSNDAAENCPACGGQPDKIVDLQADGAWCKFTIGCHKCHITGPTCDGAGEASARIRAITAWNAVVDAWNGGFATAEEGRAATPPDNEDLRLSIRGECIEHGWNPSDDQVDALLRLFVRPRRDSRGSRMVRWERQPAEEE